MDAKKLLKNLTGKVVVGADEVGRGCWAGPMVVGAVILDEPVEGLNDSKLLSKRQREDIAAKIKFSAAVWSTGWVTAKEIDELGLTAATTLAIERAVTGLPHYDIIIIDGSINYLPANPRAISLVKADSLVPAVSAASIIAKCARDEYMHEQALLYPQYGFDTHVGYGTGRHSLALAEYGITPLHRQSYKPVKSLLEQS